MPNEPLKILVDDLGRVLMQLEEHVAATNWAQARNHAKELLSLASRTYGRLDAMVDALRELNS